MFKLSYLGFPFHFQRYCISGEKPTKNLFDSDGTNELWKIISRIVTNYWHFPWKYFSQKLSFLEFIFQRYRISRYEWAQNVFNVDGTTNLWKHVSCFRDTNQHCLKVQVVTSWISLPLPALLYKWWETNLKSFQQWWDPETLKNNQQNC